MRFERLILLDRLQCAVRRDQPSALEIHLEGADDRARQDAARYAVELNRPECLGVLLEHGLDVNRRASRTGKTLAHLSAGFNHDECLTVLLAHEANVRVLNITSANIILTNY